MRDFYESDFPKKKVQKRSTLSSSLKENIYSYSMKVVDLGSITFKYYKSRIMQALVVCAHAYGRARVYYNILCMFADVLTLILYTHTHVSV